MDITSNQVEEIFSAAVNTPDRSARAAYLDHACGGDEVLRRRVEALLASHESSDSFLAAPGLRATVAAAALPLPLSERPGSVVGRYKLLQLIGEGGFGSVFMAQQDHPVRRTVALKVIKLGMDTKQVIARFEAERQALALMDHPNIARVLDAGATDAGRPYFVMELVRGVPITEYCDANNLSTRERLELFMPVCHAVQHAHQKGVIHRDIKPSNILVTMADGRPIPKVIDFGIAKATCSRLTEMTLFTEYRQMVGTPEYMSPEQAEMTGIDVDTRSDVYSLGVLLYELLTGTTPFDAKELRSKAYGEIQRIIREVDPPRPSTRISSLGATLATTAAHRRSEPRKLGQLMRGELDWVVMKALEKDRTRRYETPSGLAADVKRYLDNDPVAARPSSAAYRAAKLVRKYRGPVAAAAALLAALLLGVAGTTWMMFRATSERDRAVTLSTQLDQQRREALAAKAAAEGARAQAERDRAAAEDSEAQSRYSLLLMRTVFSFVGDMVTADDPAGRDPNLTVAQMLDRSVDQISRRQPVYVNRCQALIRLTLGTAYEGVDRPADAEREFRKALEHFDDYPHGTEARRKLGALLAEQGRPAEALPVLRGAIEKYRAANASNPYVLDTLKSLERVCGSTGRHPEAESYAREAAELRARLALDEPNAPLAEILTKAYARIVRDDYGAAQVLLRDGINLHAQLKAGQEDRTYVALYDNLGFALAEEGNYAEAEAAYGRALAASERLLGADHRDAAPTLAHLATVLRKQRKAEQAGAIEIRHLGIQACVLADAIREVPPSADLFRGRGHVLSRAGRFDEALPDFGKAIELDPSNHWPWYFSGCILAHSGQSDAYRAHRRAMLRQFGSTTDQYVADRTAKTCLLLPDGTDDLAGQLRLVSVVFAPGGDEGAMPWFRLLKGLAEYRQGHYGAAVDWLDKSRQTLESRFTPARTTASLLLAMAHHRLGHEDRARSLLAEARHSMDRDLPKAGAEDLAPVNVEDWLICHVIRREAEALFARR